MQFLGILPSWEEIFRGLMAMLCQFIYPLVSMLYNLFIYVSKVNILSNDQIQPIYARVTMILTIIMVFYVTFEFVKYIVQPDMITDKEKGASKLIYKMIAVVVLIAFVPSIFTYAMRIQNIIIEKGIIGKVILGTGGTISDNYGGSFSANIFSMFYGVPDEYANKDCDGVPCGAVVGMNIQSLSENGHLHYLTKGLNAAEETNLNFNGNKGKTNLIYITFDGLFAVIVGCFLVYILALYCVDVGIRWAQLIFLQVISPIPIIAYLSPKKDGMFQKWVKQCFTTYLDLFLRLAIIYFVLLICSILLDAVNSDTIFEEGGLFYNLKEVSNGMLALVVITLILGVMMFAKKAPNMLKELFPSTNAASGNFGLKGGDRGFKAVGRVARGAAGSAIGAVSGAATGIAQGWRRSKAQGADGKEKGTGAGIWGATKGAFRGIAGGAARGAYHGSKKDGKFGDMFTGAKKQVESNKRFGNREENGYTLGHQIGDRMRSTFGAPSRVEAQEAAKAPISRHEEHLKKVADTRSKIEDRALSKIQEGKGGDAARSYLASEQRLRELKEDPSVRAREFGVSKYSTQAEADAAYEAEKVLAKASVNKANFVDSTTGIFDQIAYDQAVKAAEAKVDKSAFKTGYATQAEADAAYEAELQRQAKIIADKKDEAVAEYVQTSGDGAIDSMLTELTTDIAEYNQTADTQTEIRDKDGNVISVGRRITYTNDSSPEGTVIDAEAIKGDFLAFSDFVKKGDIKQVQDANISEIIRRDAAIDRIKRETDGSGIGEGKK